MSKPRRSDIPDDVVAKRLADLADIDQLMRALRDARFTGDRVREKPVQRESSRDSKHDQPSRDLP